MTVLAHLPSRTFAVVLLSFAVAACGQAQENRDDANPGTPAGSSPAAGSPSATSPSASATPPPAAPGGDAADGGVPLAEAIRKISVAAEAREGYKRGAFKHWVDADKDGCDTREEVLLAEAVKAPEQGAGCKISGGSWKSLYDGAVVNDPKGLDIDHVVPLAEAWDSGADAWSAERRQAYANDLDADRSLIAVTAKTNRSKGDKDPARWMPPAASAQCPYLADWIAAKLRWNLTADTAEAAALTRYAAACPTATVTYESAT
ncbi:HNH endonuclease family protein [Streptomyces sp. NPDC056549]|uniref:HNH endonuclease family protein n=1 Tax=Streptomyces sp. NPDC056549 TaxID=3345864 RepID=UPI0036892D63